MVDLLRFGERTARYLITIAQHPDLSNRQYTADLPPSWFTLAALARLPEGEVPRRIAAGEITPELTAATAEGWAKSAAEARPPGSGRRPRRSDPPPPPPAPVPDEAAIVAAVDAIRLGKTRAEIGRALGLTGAKLVEIDAIARDRLATAPTPKRPRRWNDQTDTARSRSIREQRASHEARVQRLARYRRVVADLISALDTTDLVSYVDLDAMAWEELDALWDDLITAADVLAEARTTILGRRGAMHLRDRIAKLDALGAGDGPEAEQARRRAARLRLDLPGELATLRVIEGGAT
jgi:hypothetical protein